MRINNIDNTYFKARNHKIRQADLLVRKINKEIPTISMNKYAHFYKAPDFIYKDFFGNLDDKFYENVREPLEAILNSTNALEYFKTALKYLKETPYANCNELVDIAQIIFDLNGIKTFKTLLEPNIDHVCLIAHIDQTKTFREISVECAAKDAKSLHNIIIIDPWLNFADFAPNANYKYKNDFSKFIEDPVSRTLYNVLLLENIPELSFTPYLEKNLVATDEEKAELAKSFPNLILSK